MDIQELIRSATHQIQSLQKKSNGSKSKNPLTAVTSMSNLAWERFGKVGDKLRSILDGAREVAVNVVGENSGEGELQVRPLVE